MDMEQYIDEVMKDLPKELGGIAATPAAEHMFKTISDAGYLDQETAELFHHEKRYIIDFYDVNRHGKL